MALVNQTLKLEITPGGVPPKLHVTEYDENMQVVAQLFQRGQYYEIPSGTTAKVDGTLAGHPFSADATVDGSTVTFELTKGMTAYAGRAWTKIKLTKDGKPVSTCGFWLECDRAGVEAGDVIGAPDFEDQIQQGVAAWLDEHGASGLPPGGQAGQVLVSDGHGGGVWVDWDGGVSSVIEFDDRNDYVIDYLTASASYTAANRATVSVISQYASTIVQDQDCPIPFDGVYNLMPNVETEIGRVTVTRKNVAPRMLKLENVWNVRDCGGYSADGGNVKYGMLFRGSRLNNATITDLELLAEVGIKLDLDIRDSGNAGNGHIPNADYLNVPLTNAYAQMIQSEATAAANAVKAAMESIVANKPVYVHCASGADRTGCICAMLEAVLGMSDADIDRDFELTCFSDTENLTGHHRNGGSWMAFWAALPTDQGSAKMNVVKFLRDNGVTTDLLNSFRRAMIVGSPQDVDIPTCTITSALTHCATSNSATTVYKGASYTATITPEGGYTMQLINVTMGGTDITSSAVSGSTISIASVTGNVVITAVAQEVTNYTNVVRTSEALDSTAVYNGGLGYKNGYYTSVGKESANAADCCTGLIPYTISADTQPTDVIYIKGYTGSTSASHTRFSYWTAAKAYKAEINGFLSSTAGAFVFDVETLGTGYYKLTPKSGAHHSINGVGYIRFSFAGTDGANVIITRNEPIE